MKRIITLFAIIVLSHFSAFSQDKYEMVIEKKDGSEIAVNTEDIQRIYFRERNNGGGSGTSYLTCPDANHPHMIDLGLPSGTKWACCNVGATTPEGHGNYYAWGETQSKNTYDWNTYKYGNSDDDVVNIGSDIAGTSYDAATANWGAEWHMPTIQQCIELIRNTTSEVKIQNGVKGRLFTGSNGGSIFLPFGGSYRAAHLYDSGSMGYYWSSTIDGGSPYMARILAVISTKAYTGDSNGREYGLSVRPVQ